jgi:hypothetical protein
MLKSTTSSETGLVASNLHCTTFSTIWLMASGALALEGSAQEGQKLQRFAWRAGMHRI